MKNKKGAEMTIGTIIIIILALVVLVILVYGFSTGWTNLWEKITNFGGGKVNVQTVVQSCQLACTTNSQYDYCKTRKLIEDKDADGKMETRNVKCKDLEGTTYGLDVCSIECEPTTKKCTGIANSCNTFDETSCPAQKVCKWNIQTKLCEGTTTSCDTLGETDCTNQKGCTLG